MLIYPGPGCDPHTAKAALPDFEAAYGTFQEHVVMEGKVFAIALQAGGLLHETSLDSSSHFIRPSHLLILTLF